MSNIVKPNIFGYLILVGIFVYLAAGAGANEKSGEEINWQVISNGGIINGISTNYVHSGTVSQTATGSGSSTNYIVRHGFWQNFGTIAGCCDTPGDANDDGIVNILDITYLISFLYKGGPAPPCLNEGDPKGDCNINILDITYLISFLYKGGPAPVCGCVE